MSGATAAPARILDRDLRADLAQAAPGPIRISSYHVHDIEGALSAADDAERAGEPLILVLDHASHRWLLFAKGPNACIRCFQLARQHSWSLPLTRSSASRDTGRPTDPLVDALVRAQIMSFAGNGGRADGDGQRIRLIDTARGDVSDHLLVRHPDCAHCDPLPPDSREAAQAMFDDDAGTSGFRAVSLARLAETVVPVAKDDRLGLVRRVRRQLAQPILSSATATLYPFRDPSALEQGYGRSGCLADDPIVAMIEALERYAGMRPRGRKTMVTARYDDLGADAIDPQSFILHDPRQHDEPGYALSRYSPGTVYDWVWAYSFRRDAGVLVPLQLGYYDLDLPSKVTGGIFVHEVSNGCAAGSTIAEATLCGLLEVIERDAFLTSWYSGRALQRIDAGGCRAPFVRAMLARLAAEGLHADIYDITADIPVAAVAVRILDPDRRFGPASIYAAGAHLDGAKALQAALTEAVTTIRRHTADERTEALAKGLAMLDDPTKVKTMIDHQLQCWPDEALARRSFAEAGGAPTASDRMPSLGSGVDAIPTRQLLANLVIDTLGACEDILVVDQSFEPVARHGLRFVKVLAPGLLPMTFGHRYRRLSTARLARALGEDFSVSACRNDPHIFP